MCVSVRRARVCVCSPRVRDEMEDVSLRRGEHGGRRGFRARGCGVDVVRASERHREASHRRRRVARHRADVRGAARGRRGGGAHSLLTRVFGAHSLFAKGP